jgi:hypothetical protein
MMCLAVWCPNPQLHSGDNTEGTHAGYKKAFKLILPVCSRTAKAVFSFRRSWWSARTSVLGGASMEVEGAGLSVRPSLTHTLSL